MAVSLPTLVLVSLLCCCVISETTKWSKTLTQGLPCVSVIHCDCDCDSYNQQAAFIAVNIVCMKLIELTVPMK